MTQSPQNRDGSRVLPPFSPGYRLSRRDILVLIAGSAGAFALASIQLWIGLAMAFVVGHFFLFCNVLRMARPLELIWAGVFCVFAVVAGLTGSIAWPMLFVISTASTLIVGVVQLRRADYHGVGWRLINPQLPTWWERRWSTENFLSIPPEHRHDNGE